MNLVALERWRQFLIWLQENHPSPHVDKAREATERKLFKQLDRSING